MASTNFPGGINVVDNTVIQDADGNVYCNNLTVNDTISYTNFAASGTVSTSGMQFVAGGGTVNITGLGVYVTSTATSMTFNFPDSPNDGQWLGICCTASISSVTTNPGSGQTILEDIGSTSGSQQFWWIYNASTTTWYRLFG